MHRTPYWIALLCTLATFPRYSFGLESWGEGGDWPKNWPAELEPFRKRASSGSNGTCLMYDIGFASQDEFEHLWPVLLKLKSKSAPLVLKTAEAPDDYWPTFLQKGPKIRIRCPEDVTYLKNETGSYDLVAPWIIDVASKEGILPAYVVKDRTDANSTWEAVNVSKWGIDEFRRFGSRPKVARVSLWLFVDGRVIDLNRVRFPPDTEIVDRRKRLSDVGPTPQSE